MASRRLLMAHHYPSESSGRHYQISSSSSSSLESVPPHVFEQRMDQTQMMLRRLYGDQAPESWADVAPQPVHQDHVVSEKQRRWQERQRFYQQCEEDPNDVFATMGHWENHPAARKSQFGRPPPPPPAQQRHAFNQPGMGEQRDVFANIGEWGAPSKTVPPLMAQRAPPLPLQMPMPQPPPAPQNHRAQSLESPTASINSSSEDQNFWKCFEIINPSNKTSRSPSLKSQSPTPFFSNLQ